MRRISAPLRTTIFSNRSVGGVPIGCTNSGGIYATYQLAIGEDFNTPLNVVNAANPLGEYFTTHVYSSGARCFPGSLYGYDMDSFHTGAQDFNKGVPVGSNNMRAINSSLTMDARLASAYEFLNIYSTLNAGPVVNSMIHTGGLVGVTAPCIIEARVRCTSPNYANTDWHPTCFWALNTTPLANGTGSPGWLEWDAGEHTIPFTFNCNYHGTITGPGVSNPIGSSAIPNDGLYHTYTMVLTASAATFYLDGVLSGTMAQDCTNTLKPYYLLITNHLTGYTPANWVGNTSSLQVDWWRMWVPASNGAPVLRPLLTGNGNQVNFNTSMNVTLPSATALWGSAVNDYIQCIKNEDFEPGSSVQNSGVYLQVPSGLTLTGRTLTGITTDQKPGRLHITVMPYVAGGTAGMPYRDWVDVGPVVHAITISCLTGFPFSYDMYRKCDCGTLSPNQIINMSSIPSGATLDAQGILSGTITPTGLTTMSTTVTNAVGQSFTNSSTVQIQVHTVPVPAFDLAGNTGTDLAGSSVGMRVSTNYGMTIVLLTIDVVGTGGAASVSSIVSANGLTFTNRQKVTWGASGNNSHEIWYAVATEAIYNELVTVNFSGAMTYTSNVAYGLLTQINQSVPWDVNASLSGGGATNTAHDVDGTQNISVTVSTTAAFTVLIATWAVTGDYGTITPPSGFTQLGADSSKDFKTYYQAVSTAQSSTTVTYSWTGTTTARVLIVDALQCL